MLNSDPGFFVGAISVSAIWIGTIAFKHLQMRRTKLRILEHQIRELERDTENGRKNIYNYIDRRLDGLKSIYQRLEVLEHKELIKEKESCQDAK